MKNSMWLLLLSVGFCAISSWRGNYELDITCASIFIGAYFITKTLETNKNS